MPAPDAAPSRRARPLPPEARRAQLIAAAVPLLAAHGERVTTRQIAAAAGVAEGTIFRAFPDKQALLDAAIAHCFDLRVTAAQLAEVDPALPLRERVAAITAIVQRRLAQVFDLVVALRGHPAAHGAAAAARPATPEDNPIRAEVVRLLEPDAHRFRCPVPEVARRLRLIAIAGSHPLLCEGRPLDADEIVSLLLDGVLVPEKGAAAC